MNLKRGFLLVLMSHLLRLGSGMVIFIVLARQLGPHEFGRFSLWLAIATLLSVPTNFGFGAMVLRSFGVAPESATKTMGAVLTAKLAIGGSTILIAICALPFISTSDRWLFAMLALAQLCESFSEYYVLSFRARSDFKGETITASIVSAQHIVLMIASSTVFPTPQAIAIAFAASRALGLLLTRYRALGSFGAIRLSSLREGFAAMRAAWAYAVELGLLTTYSQLDTLVINWILGTAAVGLYQAGMKLVQGAGRVAPVLAQIILPELARTAQNQAAFKSQARRTFFVFSAVGLVGGCILALGASHITKWLFGPAYAPLVQLLPWFGLLFLLKFTETGMGLILVALGRQGSKVWLVATQLILMLVVGTIAMFNAGMLGWLVANSASLLFLLLLYIRLMRR